MAEHATPLHETTAPALDPEMHRRRWIILSLLFCITVVNFIDRQTLSELAPVIQSVFHLSAAAYGRIVAALQFGMMSGEFPMGWLMDRVGTRLGLSFAVLWWSTATGAQVFTGSGFQFGLVRFWMGTGECGNFSGGVKAVTRLFSKRERTLAIGIFNGGSMVGTTIAPLLIIFLYQRFGFRVAFLVPALLGVIWLIAWVLIYKHEPPAADPAGVPMVSLRTMLRDSSSWAVMACRFFIGPVIQFYWYWLPSYLYSVRHMSLTQIGLLSWIPFFMGGSGGILGGWAASLMQKRGVPLLRMRHVLMYGSAIVCCASFFVPYSSGRFIALLMIGIAMLADNFLSAHMYGAITDLFPDQQVGRATGLTGVAGGLSGLLFPLLTGVLVDKVGYTPAFVMVALMPLLGTISLFVLGRKYHTMKETAMA